MCNLLIIFILILCVLVNVLHVWNCEAFVQIYMCGFESESVLYDLLKYLFVTTSPGAHITIPYFSTATGNVHVNRTFCLSDGKLLFIYNNKSSKFGL